MAHLCAASPGRAVCAVFQPPAASDDRRSRTARTPTPVSACARAVRKGSHRSAQRADSSGPHPRAECASTKAADDRAADTTRQRRGACAQPAADRVQLPAAPHAASMRPCLAPSGAEGALRYAPAPGQHASAAVLAPTSQLHRAVRVRTLTRGSPAAVRCCVCARAATYVRVPTFATTHRSSRYSQCTCSAVGLAV
jgi:hypothetical protein